MSCDKSECVKAKLSPCSLGVAFGVVKGVCFLGMAWISAFWGFGTPMVEHVAQFYHGYGSSVMGGLIGGAYGLVLGYIFGLVFGYVYNFCLCHCCCPLCKKSNAS